MSIPRFPTVEKKLGESIIIGAAINQKASEVKAVMLQELASTALGKRLLSEGALRFAALGGKMVRGYFVWNDAYGPGKFTFPMNPSAISDNVSPKWATHEVPGQWRPVYQFVNGGERTISFKLEFFYQDRDRRVIREQLLTLRNLAQRGPTKGVGMYDGPPVIRFYFGQLFQGQTFLMKSVQQEAFDLFDPLSLLPLRATVSLELMEVVTDPWEPTMGGSSIQPGGRR